MEIRELAKEEHWKTRALYEEVFSEDSASFVEYYYTEKTKDNRIYVAEEDGMICAMLHLNPYTLMVQGNEKQSYYIVAVATKKNYRKKGYMRALIFQVMQDLYAEGILFVYLMPAKEEIYLPFDFRTVYEQKKHMDPEAVTREKAIQETDLQAYETACEKDCGQMAEAAERFLSGKYQVYAKRTKEYYQRLLKECASDGGKIMIRQSPGPAGTGKAQTLVGNHKAGQEILDIRLIFPDEEKEEKPARIMMRIVDVRRLLMCLRVTYLMSVCFQVTDPVIAENNRCVNLLGTEAAKLMLMDGRPENSEGTLTVSALTELVFGAKSVEEISLEPGVAMTDRLKGELKKIVTLSKICLDEVV